MPLTAEYDADIPVIEAIQQGDRDAFADFVWAHDRWVRGMVLGVLGDRDAVDDVAQQVWVAVWMRIGELRDTRRWRPWLYRLAHNAAIDAHRARVRRRSAVGQAPIAVRSEGAAPTPPQELSEAERRRAVTEAIQALPALYREPFVLRHLLDWSYREIAAAMDMPVDMVETRLVRARRMLRETLDGKV